MQRRGAAAVFAIVLLGTTCLAGPAQAAFPGANGRIVFVRSGGSENSIVTIAADGTDEQPLLTADGTEYLRDPVWSPGGKFIAFTRIIDGDSDIWRMAGDGSGLVQLTSGPAADQHPAWSPDGARIAFESNRTGDREIHTMRVDGSDVVRITHRPGIDAYPAWSPDGRRIAFASDAHDRLEIHTMDPDGTDIQRVTVADPLWDEAHRDPEWSPTGTVIVFDRTDPDRSDAIEAVEVASGTRRTLDLPAGDRFDGAFAPDPAAPVADAIVYAWAAWTVTDSSDLYVRSSAPGATPEPLTTPST